MVEVWTKSKKMYENGWLSIVYRPYSFLKKFTLHRRFESWSAIPYQITYTRKELKELYELIGTVLEDTNE